MNGRAYDYNLGRFLSVDPFIQAPGNSQSMNPYSYIMNNPLSGTDPSGYACKNEGAQGECEPKKNKRSGKGFVSNIQSPIKNGVKISHGVGLSGEAEKIEEVGSKLEDEGYSLSSGKTKSDGTVEAFYTKSYSGTTESVSDAVGGVATKVGLAELGVESASLAAGALSSYKIVPQFSPVGGVYSWQVLSNNSNFAGMRLNTVGFSSALGKIGRGLGVAGIGLSFYSNYKNPNFTSTEVAGKLGLDIIIANIAMRAGPWGLAIGGGYMALDYHFNTHHGGWVNGMTFYGDLQNQLRKLPFQMGAHGIQEFNSMMNNGLNNAKRNFDYYSTNPRAVQTDMFNVPHIDYKGQ